MYIILELADLGQLAKWDFEKEIYNRNEKIIECITNKMKETGEMVPNEEIREIE